MQTRCRSQHPPSTPLPVPRPCSCLLSCIPNAVFFPPSLLFQMQCRLDWWLVCRLSASLVPGVSRWWGAQAFCVPPLSLSASGLLPHRAEQNRPPLEYAVPPTFSSRPPRISVAHLLAQESAAAAEDSPPAQWPLPALTASSQWCYHNGNETNCKLPSHHYCNTTSQIFQGCTHDGFLWLTFCWFTIVGCRHPVHLTTHPVKPHFCLSVILKACNMF